MGRDGAGAGQVGAAPGLLLGGDGRPEVVSWHLGVQESQACGPEPKVPEAGPPLGAWEAGWGLNSDVGL